MMKQSGDSSRDDMYEQLDTRGGSHQVDADNQQVGLTHPEVRLCVCRTMS